MPTNVTYLEVAGVRHEIFPTQEPMRLLSSDGTVLFTLTEAGSLAPDTLQVADGGTVTQATSITTAVTLNTSSGQITTVASPSIAAGAEATFTVNNSKVAVTDVVAVSVVNQFTDGLVEAFVSDIGAGTFNITLTNHAAAAVSAGSAVISFVVIKGSAT